MSLYENMRSLDELAFRLHTGTHTHEDLIYLANCLERLCDGQDPEGVLRLKQSSGKKRKMYKTHKRNVGAIKRIAALTDLMAATIDANGNVVIYEDDEADRPMTKVAVINVSDETGITYGTLDQYWTEEKYRKYKDPSS